MRREADLSPAKRALLEKWTQGEVEVMPQSISVRPSDSHQPLSFSQQRQLFLELLEPGSAVNNLSICLMLEGELDVAALEGAGVRMLDRHETLRTQFAMDRGVPVPEQSRAARVAISMVDLGRLPEEQRLDEALRHAREDAVEPIELTRAPLLRLTLYRLAARRHVLSVLVHHTIADGWSLAVFERDLLAFYREITSGIPAELPDLAIQYSDYAHWQRDPHRSRDLADELAYWRERLAGAPAALDLPFDHPRGTRQTFAGGTHHFQIESELESAVRRLGRSEGVTLFMILVAAFNVVLHRYSGSADISVGTPVAGRSRPEVQELIGSFINTLVLRTDLSGNPTFRELLRRVRSTAVGAYAHQEVPFERLVAELKPERDLARTPLFQVMFNLQAARFGRLDVAGLTVRPLPLESDTSQFDLSFVISERDEGLAGSAQYNRDLFEPATIERMATSYGMLLRHVVEDPNTPLSRLRVLDEAEERRLLTARNRTEREYPGHLRIDELIEATAARVPDRTAVIDGARQLSYRDLNRRAGALAAHLTALGVGPDVRVGICIDRSADLVTALLGVLKAGGVYVPVNPSDPPRRTADVLEDAAVRILISERGIEVPKPADCRVVRLSDVDWSADRAGATPPPAAIPRTARPETAPATSESPAYVIYTSGSTGRPKGVMVPHRAVVNFLCSMAERPGFDPSDVLLAVTPLSFDISVLELFLPLIVGGIVVVAPDSVRHDPAQLAAALVEHDVTVMQATPAMWRMLVDSGWTGDSRLECLCGGETLQRDLAAALLERCGRVWNMYGPTETTVWSAVGRVHTADDVATLGEPIANTQLYVLDEYLAPAPPGVTAELFIGGDGLAQGYVNREELTRKMFPPDPFRSRGGGLRRLYRTGDAASYLPDGRIALHGRLDDQVKIRGFRVELGEVESALMEHPEVRQAVAANRKDETGRHRLVAYFIPERTPPPGADDLRAFLRDILPAYMLPAAYVPLDAFPLSSSGKIDRSSLPAPGGDRPRLGAAFVAPRNAIEGRLAKIYSRVLGIDRVGIHDNFFDIGGGSLQILEVILEAHDDDIALTPDLFFEHQTVAEMAAALGGHGVELAESR